MITDLKFAFRRLWKSPGFTSVALLTLALGIGVNTSMFSGVMALVSRPLPYPSADRLVQVFQSTSGSSREPHHSAANFLDFQARDGAIESAAAMNDKPFNLAEPGQPPERVRGLQVSAGFFNVLGIQPALGRVFTEQEDQPGANGVVVLDHGFWLRRFSGDTNIVGRVLRLDGESVTVVGVMPERFHDIMLMGPVYLWRPIAFTAEQRNNRGMHYLKCIARLRPGLSLKQARATTDVLTARLKQEHPENAPEKLLLVPLAKSSLPPQARYMMWSILGLAGFVLLIACANLANLQFARTLTRTRELAIRGALGAPRGRVVRQLLTESLLLSLLGGLLGLILAQWSNRLLSQQFVADGETVLNLPLNVRALSFALAASGLSGVAFGLLPAVLASGRDVNEALKQGARTTTGDRSQHRVQHSLVVAQVALALVLLAGAALLVNGLRNFAAVNPGWQVAGMNLGYLTLPEEKYPNDNSLRAFDDRLEQKLAELPGVQSVALAWNLPIRQFNVTSTFTIEGWPETPKGYTAEMSVNGVTPDYFATLGMDLRAGRIFSRADTAGKPDVLVINEAMARAFWPNQSPLGRRLGNAEIVGVVSDVRFPANPAELHTPYQTYRPLAQAPAHSMTVAVRGNISAATLRRVVAEVDPDQPIGNPGPARADVGTTLDRWAIGGKLLSIFAGLGVALAALGIYGVISGFVVRRTSEIGLRMALGAQWTDVLWLVLGRGLRLVLVGTALGLLGAFGLARLLAALLPALPAGQPVVLVVVMVSLLLVATIACWIPARRAASVDPLDALRTE